MSCPTVLIEDYTTLPYGSGYSPALTTGASLGSDEFGEWLYVVTRNGSARRLIRMPWPDLSFSQFIWTDSSHAFEDPCAVEDTVWFIHNNANSAGERGIFSMPTNGSGFPTYLYDSGGSAQLWSPVFDGTHVWVASTGALLKFDTSGSLVATHTYTGPGSLLYGEQIVLGSDGAVWAIYRPSGNQRDGVARFDGAWSTTAPPDSFSWYSGLVPADSGGVVVGYYISFSENDHSPGNTWWNSIIFVTSGMSATEDVCYDPGDPARLQPKKWAVWNSDHSVVAFVNIFGQILLSEFTAPLATRFWIAGWQ